MSKPADMKPPGATIPEAKTPDAKTPVGVVAVFIGPDGHQIASASCFDGVAASGYTLVQAQRALAIEQLDAHVVHAMCNSDLAACMKGFDRKVIVDRMCSEKGYRRHIVLIGHEEP